MAELYQARFMDLDIYNENYDLLCTILPENATVLDAGCGPGNITRYLLSKRTDLKILGIDLAPQMIELAVKNNPAARFEVMDVREMKMITDKFDAIAGGFCIPYLSESELSTFISDCQFHLQSNGWLYISFVEGSPSLSGPVTGSSGHTLFFHYYETNYMTDLLKINGFTIDKSFKVEYQQRKDKKDNHIILIARKTS